LRFFNEELEPNTRVSLSAPVDVIAPFDVGITGSGDTTIVFELLHIPELFDDGDVIDEDP
jgi:hypothetical protein